MTNRDNNSVVILNPLAFFHGAVLRAVNELNVSASDSAQSYLVNLLAHFINFENLYPKNDNGKREETLVLQWVSALEADTDGERVERLRKIGDVSLYISGFFSSSIRKKMVDLDYYISMGGAAYFEVSQAEGGPGSQADTFVELSEKFSTFVDVLNEVSEEHCAGMLDDKSLLEMYERWENTGSERLAKQLTRAGIVLQEPARTKIKKNS